MTGFVVCSTPAKKKETKKGVKTTQEAIDEAKAAALEKQMEGSDDKEKVTMPQAT